MPDPLALETALGLVLGRAMPLSPETVPIGGAAGRVLAEDARARTDLPPFPSSSMDGYAVRASDLPGPIPVVGQIAAGRPAERALAPGEAMAISTGGVAPDGADAVIPIELVVNIDNKRIEAQEVVAPTANIRPRGGDVAAGEIVVHAGTALGPVQLGALAAAGIAEVSCARRPRVALLSSGTELRAPGDELAPGQIYEANSYLLAAAAASAGAEVERLPSVPDDEASHRAALERGLAFDMLLTSGGVSVGPHDLMRGAGAGLGVEEVFWRVAVKPGKPVSFGVRGTTLVFGLPGNPVSSLVGFELFVRPALRALQGDAAQGPRWLPGRLGSDVRRGPARDELVRARVRLESDGVILDPLSGHESHMIVRAAGAGALVLVPRGEGLLEAGGAVRYLALAL